MSEEMNIDFGALREKAAQMMEASEAARTAAPETAPAVAAPAAVPANAPEGADPTQVRVKGATTTPPAGQGPAAVKQPETPEVEAPVAQATPADLTDESLVKVVVDGEEVVMPWKDARAGISRTQKFTKSMQQLAKDREQIEAQKADLSQLQAMRAEREGFNRFLSNPQAVAQFLLEQFPQEFAPQAAQQNQPQAGGDEIITRAEAQRMTEERTAALVRGLQTQFQTELHEKDRQINEAIAGLEHKQQTAKHAVVISTTLADIFNTNPVLKAIPNAEDLIRFEVAQMKPQTEEAALDAFRTVAQGMVEEIGKHFTNQKKVQAVVAAKTKLESTTIEPAGGTAPQIKPATFKNQDGSVNWNAVRDQARASYNPA